MTKEEQDEWQKALFPAVHNLVASMNGLPQEKTMRDNDCENNDHNEASHQGDHELLLTTNEYGDIPFLSEIPQDKECHREILCDYQDYGSVEKVSYKGKIIAHKKFDISMDDAEGDRWCNYKTFLHEREVFRNLSDLQGTHVVSVKFHSPWLTCPSLGLELGEPVVEGDIDKWDHFQWDKEDFSRMKVTLREIKKRGYEIKEDFIQGTHFVRLKKNNEDYIALMDMQFIRRIADDEINAPFEDYDVNT